jgi:DNA (cytosine-5)-methyltransferase 1
MTLKILNLYAGIGGNRKLWDGDIEVTAVEINPEIAAVYQKFFPDDKVIVGDAHEYLLEHFEEFDFIWSSPPCQSHSTIRKNTSVGSGKSKTVYPDFKLWQEIILLKHYFNGKWVVENVDTIYYECPIKPQHSGSHYFWSNFVIPENNPVIKQTRCHGAVLSEQYKRKGFDLTGISINHRKDQIMQNCVEPELGLHIFNLAFKEPQITLNNIQ